MSDKDVSALDANLTVKPDLLSANLGLFLPYHFLHVYIFFFTCIHNTQNITDTGLGVESVYVSCRKEDEGQLILGTLTSRQNIFLEGRLLFLF